MKRIPPIEQIKSPTAILTSDWHLREDVPVCRTDNFLDAQTNKLKFIKHLQIKWNCPVLISGDIFHAWKPSPFLLSWTIENLPNNVILIPGQHDLPQHSIDLLYKSGICVLEKAEKVKILSEGEYIEITTIKDSIIRIYGFPFGSNLISAEKEDGIVKVALIHELTYSKKIPYPDCKLDNAEKLLKRLKNWDLIVVGDNHQSFEVELDDRKLISPGSLSRQTADQIDFRPRVYLWYADTNTVEPVYIPIEDGAVSRDHLIRKQERDDRLEAFVSKLNNDWEGTVSFEENLERLMKENEIGDKIKEIVYKAVEI
jgi:DNA repair exonuclease SbcCD nuclease subunit